MSTGAPTRRGVRREWTIAYWVWLVVFVIAGGAWTLSINPPDPNPWHWVRALCLIVVGFSGLLWIGRKRRA